MHLIYLLFIYFLFVCLFIYLLIYFHFFFVHLQVPALEVQVEADLLTHPTPPQEVLPEGNLIPLIQLVSQTFLRAHSHRFMVPATLLWLTIAWSPVPLQHPQIAVWVMRLWKHRWGLLWRIKYEEAQEHCLNKHRLFVILIIVLSLEIVGNFLLLGSPNDVDKPGLEITASQVTMSGQK